MTTTKQEQSGIQEINLEITDSGRSGRIEPLEHPQAMLPWMLDQCRRAASLHMPMRVEWKEWMAWARYRCSNPTVDVDAKVKEELAESESDELRVRQHI